MPVFIINHKIRIMSVKIIFSDIDGTLLNKNREVSQQTISQIKAIKENIPFVLVSARMPKQMHYIQKDLGIEDTPVIAYNGALVMHGQEKIHSVEIPISLIESLVQYNEEITDGQIHISLYNSDEWYVPSYDDWAKREENNTKTTPKILSTEKVIEKWKSEGKGAHKVMLMGDVKYIEPMFQYLTAVLGCEVHIYRAKDTYIEIADIKVSKLVGIQALLNCRYPFSLSEVMAFGDNYNDIEMLQSVGYGIAVGNARDEVKAIAKDITLHHQEDGVAQYIKNFFNL